MYFEGTNVYLIIGIAAVTIMLLVIAGLFVYNHFAGRQDRAVHRIEGRMRDEDLRRIRAAVSEAIEDARGTKAAADSSAAGVRAEAENTPEAIEAAMQSAGRAPDAPVQAGSRESMAGSGRLHGETAAGAAGDWAEELAGMSASAGQAPQDEEFGDMAYRRGRSGKLYERTELESQIKE